MTSATDRMNGWPWNAFAGQKVVCIREIKFCPKQDYKNEIFPQKNQILTIREVGANEAGPWFRFCEIVNPLNLYKEGRDEAVFRYTLFRPIQIRDTSARVAEIKRLALGVRDEVRA